MIGPNHCKDDRLDTLYFAGFCLFIGVIIFWGYRVDDHEEFNAGSGSKKFSIKKPGVKKPGAEPSPQADRDDQKDTPRANLL